MAEHAEGQARSVTVLELSGARALGLNLEVLEGHDAMGNEISSPRIEKLGLALAGFGGFIRPGRVPVLGGSEMNYLRILEPAVRSAATSRLHGQRISCIVVTKGLEPPDELLQLARRDRIHVLRTSALSSVFITKIGDYRDARLAPRYIPPTYRNARGAGPKRGDAGRGGGAYSASKESGIYALQGTSEDGGYEFEPASG